MDSLLDAGRLAAILLIALVLPQVLGYGFYRWARSKHTSLRTAAFLIAPTVFYAIAYEYWGYQARAIRSEGHYVCGMFGAAAGFTTFYGTLLHLAVSIIWLTIVSFVWKRKKLGLLPENK